MNFCWYSNRPEDSLAGLLIDIDGQKRHGTVPRGKIRPDFWSEQRRQGNRLLPDPFKDVMNGISQPFLQVVRDYHSPRASFGDGKVLLVGEAQTLFRPHTSFSTNQAAFDCLSLERLMKDEISAAEWERQVVAFGHLHWLRSIWYGEWFQRPLYTSIFAGIQYWTTAAKYAIEQNLWLAGF